MPTLRHQDIRNDLLGDLSEAGRRQYEAFGAVQEARQLTARLVELREAANLSQRQAAKQAGIDQADLSRIESGQVTPSLPTLLRLLDTVGGTLILARRRSASPANKGAQNVGRPSAVAAKTGQSGGRKRATAQSRAAVAVKATRRP